MESRKDNQYLRVFFKVKEKYNRQESRPGYPRGSLSLLRHLGGNKNALDTLEKELSQYSDSDYSVDFPGIIIRHFKENPSFHYHSFNTYLLDELLEAFPDSSNWQKWNPYPLEFYQGRMFVFSSANYNDVFKVGLKAENISSSLDDYVNQKAGLIAYKAISQAQLTQASKSPNTFLYLYEINYRGCEAIDIDETHKKRRQDLPSSTACISVIDQIKPADIKCVQIYQGMCRTDQYNDSTYLEERRPDCIPTSKLILPARDYPHTILASIRNPQQNECLKFRV